MAKTYNNLTTEAQVCETVHTNCELRTGKSESSLTLTSLLNSQLPSQFPSPLTSFPFPSASKEQDPRFPRLS